MESTRNHSTSGDPHLSETSSNSSALTKGDNVPETSLLDDPLPHGNGRQPQKGQATCAQAFYSQHRLPAEIEKSQVPEASDHPFDKHHSAALDRAMKTTGKIFLLLTMPARAATPPSIPVDSGQSSSPQTPSKALITPKRFPLFKHAPHSLIRDHVRKDLVSQVVVGGLVRHEVLSDILGGNTQTISIRTNRQGKARHAAQRYRQRGLFTLRLSDERWTATDLDHPPSEPQHSFMRPQTSESIGTQTHAYRVHPMA